MKQGKLGSGTSSSATDGAQILARVTYEGALHLAEIAHAIIGSLHMPLVALFGAQLERNAALFGRLASCSTVEDAFDVYTAYAASTLEHCERELAKAIDAGTRITNLALAAGLQPLLVACPRPASGAFEGFAPISPPQPRSRETA